MRRVPLVLVPLLFAATLVAQPRLTLDYPAMATPAGAAARAEAGRAGDVDRAPRRVRGSAALHPL